MTQARFRRAIWLLEKALEHAEDEVTKEAIKREIRTLIRRLEESA